MNITPILVTALMSGSGKTTLTAGLVAALVSRGLRVAPFKVGPDYIDPSYHSLAAGVPCRNLDSWMLTDDQWLQLFLRATRRSDCAVIEGVMGLYDGARYDGESGSTAEIAKRLGAAVVVVIDAAKMARSAGAAALGLMAFDRGVNIIGFIANRVGSESHGCGVAAAIEAATGRPCFGWIPRQDALCLPERHLGLVPTAEAGEWHAFIAAARETVERYINLDALLKAVQPVDCTMLLPFATDTSSDSESRRVRPAAGEPPVVAVARDDAFSFIYPENLELLEEAGAHIAFFSPLRDRTLPQGTRGIILSGGFPELYAEQLSSNESMRAQLRRAHECGLPMLAECGGLMYLTEALVQRDGAAWPMVGLLPGRSAMTAKLTMGYRLAQAAHSGPVLAAGKCVRGHEFHYSVWQDRPATLPAAFLLQPKGGQAGPPQLEGACVGNLWATYVHTHFLAAPEMATRFIEVCRETPCCQ